MTAFPGRRRAVVMSTSWQERAQQEQEFVIRAVAAGLSRTFDIDVLVPGPPAASMPDGLFDLEAVGHVGADGAGCGWPEPAGFSWTLDGQPAAVVVEYNDPGALRLAQLFAPEVRPVVIGPSNFDPKQSTLLAPAELPFHVPVNPLASDRPHVGFGFDQYLLLLTDRVTAPGSTAAPTPLAAWITAAFPRRHVVVVEDATASAWRSRALRGRIHVDTRTDLQRLMAHAWAVVDLAPGNLIARECVEALRFGVPVVVPAGNPAVAPASHEGVLPFDNVNQLLNCLDALESRTTRDAVARAARVAANDRHADPGRFVDAIRRFFDEVADPSIS